MSISTVAAIREAIGVIEETIGDVRAPLGMVLGSGLGRIADEVEDARELSYRSIPHLPASTVVGHAGKLVCGRWQGRDVVMLSGRVHRYEGHMLARVALPVQLLGAIGVDVLVVTNAAGAVNLDYEPGELMLIRDQINLSGDSPIEGPADPRIGPRFPDMTEIYDARLRPLALDVAAELGVLLHEGVYCGVRGPNYETPAEIRMIRALGGDVVGMSTVAEAIAARHMGMRVLGLSCITNYGAGMADGILEHAHVAAVAAEATGRMRDVLAAVVSRLPELKVRAEVIERIHRPAP